MLFWFFESIVNFEKVNVDRSYIIQLSHGFSGVLWYIYNRTGKFRSVLWRNAVVLVAVSLTLDFLYPFQRAGDFIDISHIKP